MGWDYKEETVTEPDIIENSQSKMPEVEQPSFPLLFNIELHSYRLVIITMFFLHSQ